MPFVGAEMDGTCVSTNNLPVLAGMFCSGPAPLSTLSGQRLILALLAIRR